MHQARCQTWTKRAWKPSRTLLEQRTDRTYANEQNGRYACMGRFSLLLILIALLASCATAHGSVRKCDGKRGTRVPMGVM